MNDTLFAVLLCGSLGMVFTGIGIVVHTLIDRDIVGRHSHAGR